MMPSLQQRCERSVAAWQDVRAKYHGKQIEVGIKDVAPHMRKVVLDMQQAVHNKMLRRLHVRRPAEPSLNTSLAPFCTARCEPTKVF